MTEPRRPGDRADEVVDAAWRSASREEPPAHVDAAILAAARSATQRAANGHRAQPRRAWWSHWQPLAAAASVAGLAFVLVQNIPRDEPPPATVESTAGSAETADVPGPAPAAAPAERLETTAPASVTPAPPVESAGRPAAASVDSVPAPPIAQEGRASPDNLRVPGARSDAAEIGAAAARMEASDAAAPQSAAAAQSKSVQMSPHEWARRIAALHESGDFTAAAAQLREFRRAYPDADRFLPEELQDWAAAQPAPDAP